MGGGEEGARDGAGACASREVARAAAAAPRPSMRARPSPPCRARTYTHAPHPALPRSVLDWFLGYFLFAFIFLFSIVQVFDLVQGALLYNFAFAKEMRVGGQRVGG